MSAVAGEQHAPVAESRHAQAREGVDARPHELELGLLAEQRPHARKNAFRFALGDGIGVPAQLEVDAPDVVRLPVQEHRLVGMEGRVEPEPAFGREICLHLHIGDQEAIAKRLTLALVAERLADEASSAVGGNQIVAAQRIRPVRRFDLQRDLVGVLLDRGDPVLPANFEVGELPGPFVQVAFDVILLEIYKRWAMMTRLGKEVEAIDFVFAEKHTALVPTDPFLDHGFAATDPVEDLKRPFGKADCARACRESVVLVEQ